LSKEQINNPLHGKTLEHIVNELVDNYGWVELYIDQQKDKFKWK